VRIQKSLEDLTVADLEALVKESVPEDVTLEYKQEMYPPSDSGRKEMLRDITAMANARGGYLLIGLREKDNVAVELVGIGDSETAAERLLSSALSGIEDRINGLTAKPITIEAGRSVLAVAVPASTRVPHMVTFQGENRFWIRHGAQKMPMTVEELRQACSRVETLYADLERFLKGQRDKAESLAARNPGIPILRCCLAPLAVKSDRLDIRMAELRELMKSPPDMRHGGFTVAWPLGTQPEPTMMGLQISASYLQTLDVFRNGYTEFRVGFTRDAQTQETKRQDGSKVRLFNQIALVEYTVSALRFYRSLCRLVAVPGPHVVAWEILNAGGVHLARYPDGRMGAAADGCYYGPRPWTDGAHLVLPPIQIPEMDAPDGVARTLMDRVWQSFGYEAAPYFSQEGGFTPPRG
jgi:hypothetical protein